MDISEKEYNKAHRKALKDGEPKGRKKKKKKKKGPVVGYYFDGKKTHTLYEDHWSIYG